jgi:hypothetical protein
MTHLPVFPLFRVGFALAPILVACTIVINIPPAQAGAQDKTEGQSPIDSGDQILIDIYQKHKLLAKSEYAKIRRVFAGRFESEHENAIRDAFGNPDSQFRKWLDDRPEIKEEFYLAVDPEHDDVARALKLFKELHDRFPEKFEDYANLAIAISVVWDKEQEVIRENPPGKAILPAGQMGAIDNFQYYTDAEIEMQGRIRYLPWEFLVFVVNHGTTLPERKWAILNYLPKRTMIGKCSGDVPYDGDSLKGEPSKLTGKLFTLPNQRIHGGTCGCQANYAARVAKSIGVPAFTAGAVNKFGGGHAWVMWVELGSVTRTGFNFSLQSNGRFRGDNYYVGNLSDPHTGTRATDRQLELRLHTLGSDIIAARQSGLVMRAYPMLREKLDLDLPQQLSFLYLVLKFCPGNEAAWETLARISREGRITKTNSKPMRQALDLMFFTFRHFPDFTWIVFDDMISYEESPLQRAALYARLAGMYEQTGRIDLSCEARLKHADLLSTDGRSSDAIASLAAGIMLFPDEGRYIPKMLDKLDSLCKGDKKAEQRLVQFYLEFLPKVPQKRGNDPSDYCIAMYKRGVEKFTLAGLSEPAKSYEILLKLMEESKPEKKKLGRPIDAVLKE